MIFEMVKEFKSKFENYASLNRISKCPLEIAFSDNRGDYCIYREDGNYFYYQNNSKIRYVNNNDNQIVHWCCEKLLKLGLEEYEEKFYDDFVDNFGSVVSKFTEDEIEFVINGKTYSVYEEFGGYYYWEFSPVLIDKNFYYVYQYKYSRSLLHKIIAYCHKILMEMKLAKNLNTIELDYYHEFIKKFPNNRLITFNSDEIRFHYYQDRCSKTFSAIEILSGMYYDFSEPFGVIDGNSKCDLDKIYSFCKKFFNETNI